MKCNVCEKPTPPGNYTCSRSCYDALKEIQAGEQSDAVRCSSTRYTVEPSDPDPYPRTLVFHRLPGSDVYEFPRRPDT